MGRGVYRRPVYDPTLVMRVLPPDSLGLTAADLAPGERRSRALDWTGLRVAHASKDPDQFAAAYAALWDAFGPAGELETADVLRRRLAWPGVFGDGYAMRYDLTSTHHGDALAAVCDGVGIVDTRRPDRPAVAFLSHILLAPPWRGSGLAGWLRAMPLRLVRDLLTDANLPPRPVNVVGEMEHPAAGDPVRLGRLTAFERAGFVKADPVRVPYRQPDFRPPEVIDADTPRPLPLALVMRRVGRENERTMPGVELRATVDALYAMYARDFAPRHMATVWESLAADPPDANPIYLLPPTAS